MKSKYWIILLTGIFAVLVILCMLLYLPGEEAAFVEVWSEGALLQTLPLNVDTTVKIKTDRGTNTVVVANGKAHVAHADCPDGTCMAQGSQNSGQIVCLPNRLVLKFTGTQSVDGVSG